MTWSIIPSKIDRRAIVMWDEKRLCHLTDDEFVAAVRAADALGDDALREASKGITGDSSRTDRAAVIVQAVIQEMGRREIKGVQRQVSPTAADEPQTEGEEDGDGNDTVH